MVEPRLQAQECPPLPSESWQRAEDGGREEVLQASLCSRETAPASATDPPGQELTLLTFLLSGEEPAAKREAQASLVLEEKLSQLRDMLSEGQSRRRGEGLKVVAFFFFLADSHWARGSCEMPVL